MKTRWSHIERMVIRTVSRAIGALSSRTQRLAALTSAESA